MEYFLYISASLSVFALGMAAGGILEHRRQKIISKIDYLLEMTEDNMKENKEILIPLAEKISHFDMRCHKSHQTWVDYEMQDPEITLEMPAVKLEN